MAADSPIPLPTEGAGLQWLLDHPEALVRAVELLNKSCALTLRLTSDLSHVGTDIAVQEDGARMILLLPLRFAFPVSPPPTLTLTISNPPTQSEVSALLASHQALQTTVSELLSRLRAVGIAP